MTYARMQTCDLDEPDASCTPGEDFPVCELDTKKGSVKVGAMICHDREFPEIARILMLKGAELIHYAQLLRAGGQPHRPVQGEGLREHGGRGHYQLRRPASERAFGGV